MFVYRNSLFVKLFSKLFCVCLPLGKLINGKHFPVNREHFPVNGEHYPVNGEHFPVNEKHFRVKEKFGLVFRKVFSLWLYLFSGKWFPGNHFPNFPAFVCHYKSWSTENTFQSKENLTWFSGKCFPEKFERKTLSGSYEKFRNIIIC